MTEIALGSKVRDVINGLEGIATAHAEHITGCIQYAVTPPVDKDGKRVDGSWEDEMRLEVIPGSRVIPAGRSEGMGMAVIALGSKVRDVVTGMEGTAICRTRWLSGSLTYTVAPKIDKDGKRVDSESVDRAQLEVIEPPLPQLMRALAGEVEGATPAKKALPPGGPQDNPRQRI